MPKTSLGSPQYIAGEAPFQQRARAALPLLVRQATQAYSAKLLYSNLVSELGMTNPRNLNYVLGYIGDALKQLSRDWGEIIPPIQCLVVNKSNGLPGRGIGYFIDAKVFAKLPRKEQRELVDHQLKDVTKYPRWLEVLEALGLKPSVVSDEAGGLRTPPNKPSRELRTGSFGRGGESLEHKRLKQFVANHPTVIGLPHRASSGTIEKPLRSGDTLDVFFSNGLDHIAVEVKSAISSCDDIERGMFQCVKYLSVLEAQQAVDNQPKSSRAILVLESKLPKQLIPLKNILGIEVFDGVVPDRS